MSRWKAPQPEDAPALAFLRGTTLNFGLDGYYGYNFNQPIGRVNLLRVPRRHRHRTYIFVTVLILCTILSVSIRVLRNLLMGSSLFALVFA